jgi:GNAT superfamily N-acetyltransferase
VGWCAAGPRSRYADLGTFDDGVWFVPCFVVHPDHRSRGVSHALLRAAVELAARHGATAIEGRPALGPEPHAGEAFRGRESVFTDLGFTQTTSGRMRIDLTGGQES